MKESKTDSANAIEWHSQHAQTYSNNYTNKKSFEERLHIWSVFIDRYSSEQFNALDLGCGDGAITIELSRKCASVCAIDASAKMLKIAKSRAKHNQSENIKFINANIQDLNSKKLGKFDLIISSSVFEYLENLDDVIRMVSDSLTKNGVFLLSLPNRKSIIRKLEPISYKTIGRPKYFKFVKQILSPHQLVEIAQKNMLTYKEHEFFGWGKSLKSKKRNKIMYSFLNPLFIAVFQKDCE